MAYVTSADLILAVGRTLALQICDPDNQGKIDEDVFGEARKSAETKVDRYAAKRYAVPFTAPIPELVRQLALDGVIYTLKMRGRSMATMEEIEAEREGTKTLEGIASGMISLGVDPGPLKSTLVVDKAGSTSNSLSPKRAARVKREGSW